MHRIAGPAVKSYVEWEYETLCPNRACSRGSRTTIKRKKRRLTYELWISEAMAVVWHLSQGIENWMRVREKWIHVDWSSWLNCEANKLKLDYEICSGLIHSGEQYQDNQGLCTFVSGIQFGELSVFEVASLELKWKRMLSDASDCITFLNRSYQRVIFGYSFEEWNMLVYRLLQRML
jgi:hypothetical protein